MMASHAGASFTLCSLILFVGVGAAAGGEWTLEVSGLPSELTFPLGQGSNCILTATVKGGEARAVWIAPRADSKVRYLLTCTGGGRFQANLADRVLSAILMAWEGEREFRVFAEGAEGIAAESIAVRYAVTKPERNPPRIYVEIGGQRREIVRRPHGGPLDDLAMRAHLSGSDLWVFPTRVPGAFASGEADEAYFFSPGGVNALEVKFEEEARRPAAEARAGMTSWPFQPAGRDALRLEVTGEIRKAWSERGEVEIIAGEADHEEARIVLKAAPSKLDLPGGKAEVTVTQRTSKELPGSKGYIRVTVGDITGGQALVEVRGRDGSVFVEERSLAVGEEAGFRLGEEEYRLKAEKLVNFLIGDDFAVLVVSAGAPSQDELAREREKILRLIKLVGTSGSTFIRGGKEYPAAEAAEHLKGKFEVVRDEVHTVGEFISKVASRSWITGIEYRVRTPDGQETTAGEWLREAARTMEAPARSGPAKEKAGSNE